MEKKNVKRVWMFGSEYTIQMLETMGGKNKNNLKGDRLYQVYFLDHESVIMNAPIHSEIGMIVQENYCQITPIPDWKDNQILANGRGAYAIFKRFLDCRENSIPKVTFIPYLLCENGSLYTDENLTLSSKNFHTASQEEEEEFKNILHNEHYVFWDSAFHKLAWMPKEGMKYCYFVGTKFEIRERIWEDSDRDFELWNLGNVIAPDKAQAIATRRKMVLLLRSLR